MQSRLHSDIFSEMVVHSHVFFSDCEGLEEVTSESSYIVSINNEEIASKTLIIKNT